MRKWLHLNMEAVVSMYEHHFDLSTFECRVLEASGKQRVEDRPWWNKLGIMMKSGTSIISLSSCHHQPNIYSCLAHQRTEVLKRVEILLQSFP
ncbi:unnamed protein product [Cuscuta epithymum]|uniref:Uncharacterized protein n=1 Tax=Cuscuta epithymum TaxID=186058 RepID=A0AAV0G664_9ASTE|nr:unnamed protein product [Cuscuta epithymum]